MKDLFLFVLNKVLKERLCGQNVKYFLLWMKSENINDSHL